MQDFILDPVQIEHKSRETISEILQHQFPGGLKYSPRELEVVKRVIHTTADFDYASNLVFNHSPIESAWTAIGEGCRIITDTCMALAGINKRVLGRYGVEARCLIADADVAAEAGRRGVTRAMVSMERALAEEGNVIFVIGNAPTALIRLLELSSGSRCNPRMIVGVPVGFVGAREAKELLAVSNIPHILSRGRKGGSNVAAAIVNAIVYMMEEPRAKAHRDGCKININRVRMRPGG